MGALASVRRDARLCAVRHGVRLCSVVHSFKKESKFFTITLYVMTAIFLLEFMFISGHDVDFCV